MQLSVQKFFVNTSIFIMNTRWKARPVALFRQARDEDLTIFYETHNRKFHQLLWEISTFKYNLSCA